VVAAGAAGFMTGADKTKLDGIATGAVSDHGALTGLADDDHPQYFNTTRGDARYVNNTGDTMTGPLELLGAQGETATFSMQPDTGTPGSDYLVIESQDGASIRAPYLILDSDSPILTMPGPQVGSMVVVAGIDVFGGALLGYQAQPVPSYSEQATTTTPVVIKVAGTTPITPWVELGLNLVLTEDIAAGDGTAMFDMILSNPTNRSGTVEFGFKLNGVELGRDITQGITANFNSTVAVSIPLINGYSIGDDIRLIARVTNNSNDGFSLTMAASVLDVAVFRIFTPGGGGGTTDIPISDEGVVITPAVTSLNFTGGGVTATAVGGDVTVTIPTGPVAASFVNFVPYLTIDSVNVQAAISELKDELDTLKSELYAYGDGTSVNAPPPPSNVAPPNSNIDASEVLFVPYLTIDATETQQAIEELKDELDTLISQLYAYN